MTQHQSKSILLTLIAISFLLLASSMSYAQDETTGSLLGVGKKAENQSKSKILVLPFRAKGMTETSALVFSNLVAQSLTNTNRYLVTSPDELQETLQKESPNLLGCLEIGCGIQAAKVVGSEQVLIGKISVTEQGSFELRIEVMNANSNKLEFADIIRFKDINRDRIIYLLAKKIADNTPIYGKVLEANSTFVVISLGRKNGVHVGDQVTVFQEQFILSDSSDESAKKQQQNIAIIKITQVGEKNSQGNYFQYTKIPTKNEKVKTYINRQKQIALIAATRKELDSRERRIYDTTKENLKEANLENKDFVRWKKTVRYWESRQKLWNWTLIGTGIAAAYLATQSQSSTDTAFMGAIVGGTYSAWNYLQARDRIKELKDEGRFKNYIPLKINIQQNRASIGYEFRF